MVRMVYWPAASVVGARWKARFATLMVLRHINFTKGLSMKDESARIKADHLMELLITHQPNLFGHREGVLEEPSAKKLAQGIAALRAELITLLTPQP